MAKLFMSFAYGWAFARPVRKVYDNLVITGLWVGAAFIIGTIEILGVLTSEFHLNGGFWDTMANFNINVAGFRIAGLFVLVWAGALTYWRVGKVEDRWSATSPPKHPGASAGTSETTIRSVKGLSSRCAPALAPPGHRRVGEEGAPDAQGHSPSGPNHGVRAGLAQFAYRFVLVCRAARRQA